MVTCADSELKAICQSNISAIIRLDMCKVTARVSFIRAINTLLKQATASHTKLMTGGHYHRVHYDTHKYIVVFWFYACLFVYVCACSCTVYPKKYAHGFALLCFVVVIHWLIFPYPSGLLHWHCGNLTIAPVPAKWPWWIWINTSCEFIMNDCITTTKQSTTKPCAYFLGYTVGVSPRHAL